eukprot:CAMPEP_0181407710 /NCGR_PEP_ID=MMETSP1110-20121109/5919_1 /TAXON_ID=174948 /ORGANISM="Symbiodinium sp., Strain CCMP421" /LENGTH=71 /DNA_ID=CAMNT_0023530145 /DNA_START=13 /DNA_END=228 /DNA_ORIENTATION=-
MQHWQKMAALFSADAPAGRISDDSGMSAQGPGDSKRELTACTEISSGISSQGAWPGTPGAVAALSSEASVT